MQWYTNINIQRHHSSAVQVIRANPDKASINIATSAPGGSKPTHSFGSKKLLRVITAVRVHTSQQDALIQRSSQLKQTDTTLVVRFW